MAVTLFDNTGYAAIIVVKSPSRELAVSVSPIETAVQKLANHELHGSQLWADGCVPPVCQILLPAINRYRLTVGK